MFYDLIKTFWSEMLHLDSFKTDYLAMITSIVVVFSLLMLFIGIFCRTGRFSAILLVVVITISCFFATDHYFTRKSAPSDVTDTETVTETESHTAAVKGGEGV